MKMPESLQKKLDQMSADDKISVYTPKILKEEDISQGVYSHLGVYINKETSSVEIPSVTIPEITGRYSKYNVEDREVKLKDLPMEKYSLTFDAPNYGDESKGTHEVEWEKERYQREIIPAKGFSIKIKAIDKSRNLYEFEISKSFSKDEEDLFYAVNLLQESVGAVNVRASDEDTDYSKFEQVEWELFPPEEREKIFEKFLSGKDIDKGRLDVYKERLEFLESLKPIMYVYGVTGLGSYMGAKIQEDLVVFENQKYGNAIYIMFEDWEKLSKLSRTELLKRPSLNYERVVHAEGWQDEVRRIIRQRSTNGKEEDI